MATNALQLFTEGHAEYERWINAARYPQAIRAFFLQSKLLGSGQRVLDAGCGTGVVTLAFREALERRGLAPGLTQAFDLTPAMIERFNVVLAERRIDGVEVVRADVLDLDELPQGWDGYDLVLTASMMEYLPRKRIAEALNGLRLRLREGGRLVLFITRPTWYTMPVVGWLWRSNLYTAAQLKRTFAEAGFSSFSFPGPARLTRFQHIVEATR